MSSRRRSGLFRHRQSRFFVRLLPSISLPFVLVVTFTKVTVGSEPWQGPTSGAGGPIGGQLAADVVPFSPCPRRTGGRDVTAAFPYAAHTVRCGPSGPGGGTIGPLPGRGRAATLGEQHPLSYADA